MNMYFINRVKSEGNTVTPWMNEMLNLGFTCMYVLLNGKKEHYSIQDKNYARLKYHKKELYFDIVKSKNNVIKILNLRSSIFQMFFIVCISFLIIFLIQLQ